MTSPGFGKLVPIQADMLALCGFNLDSQRDNTQHLPDDRRIQIMKLGLKGLERRTGKHFGYDIAAWESYLESADTDEYRHPYGYRTTLANVQAAKADPEVARLFALIQSDPNSK